MEQSAVAPGEAHHRLVDGGVAVGIQLHGGAHHVGGLGALSPQQVHLVHGVQQLAVAGLEAVNLRDGPGDDDAHGVGHIVDLQRLGDGLLQHLGAQAHDVGVVLMGIVFGCLLFCHGIPSFMLNRRTGDRGRVQRAIHESPLHTGLRYQFVGAVHERSAPSNL